MDIIKLVEKLLTFQEPEADRTFILVENEAETGNKIHRDSTSDFLNGVDYKNTKISPGLTENKKIIAELFSVPENSDLVIKEFEIQSNPSLKAMAVFMDGLVDKAVLQYAVFEPLMLHGDHQSNRPDSLSSNDGNTISVIDNILQKLLLVNQTKKKDTYGAVINAIIVGETALFIENASETIILETKGWKDRTIEQPLNEKTIRGPHEAFNENYRENIGLIRKTLPNHNLINDTIYFGSEQKGFCAVLYLKNITNPSLVTEVKRRLSSIKTDYMPDSGLEQYIEDHPYLILPQTRVTERPDIVVSSLLEGRVAIIAGNSPNAIIVPATFWSFLHAPDDIYFRFPFGTFLRVIRMLAMLFTLLLPGLYIAITNFHQEMIPTDLLFAIAGAREKVPFPTIIEVLLMEFSFELIREAGIKIPGLIGPTLGIIGALILGQAAVAANIVSPILIIVVAITGIGSFAIPDYSMAFSFRLIRFLYIVAAAILGLYGIALTAFINLALMCHMKSFGVPYLAPLTPRSKGGIKSFVRYPIWEQETAPDETNPIKRKRQPRISRGWTNKEPEGRKE
jgi:spore germination protein KA